MAPPELPLATTPGERFDELVLDAVDDLRRRNAERLDGIDFAVEDVPALEGWDRDWVPLGRSYPASLTRRARVVVYRRPVEGRAEGREETAELVRDVVVEELAELLGVEPEELDPDG